MSKDNNSLLAYVPSWFYSSHDGFDRAANTVSSLVDATGEHLSNAYNAVESYVSDPETVRTTSEYAEATETVLGDYGKRGLSTLGRVLKNAPEFIQNNSDRIGVVSDPNDSRYENNFSTQCLQLAGNTLENTGEYLDQVQAAVPGEYQAVKKQFNGGLLSFGAEALVTTGLAIAGGALLGPLGAMALCGLASAVFSQARNQRSDGSFDYKKIALDGLIGGVCGLIGGGAAKLGGSLIAGGAKSLFGKIATTVARTALGGFIGGLFSGSKSASDDAYRQYQQTGRVNKSQLLSTFAENACTGVYIGALGGAVAAPLFSGGINLLGGTLQCGTSATLNGFSNIGRGMLWSGRAITYGVKTAAPVAIPMAIGVGGTLLYQQYQKNQVAQAAVLTSPF